MRPDDASQHITNRFADTSPLPDKADKSINKRNADSSKGRNVSFAKHIGNVAKQRWISDAAYYKAAARGFSPGNELNDWLAAEQDFIEMQVNRYLAIAKEDGLSIAGLRQLAKALGAEKPERLDSEAELIRLIQIASHQFPCFRTQFGELCDHHTDCQWQTECQKLIAEWQQG
ncbi:MAG: DUF2934 domain-containing protein [Methyloglobulus sp.]|nr:DUF2934 domain-containing protein [Methyloglobulus sp.]